MKLDMEDLHKKLEMAELMIQQVPIILLGCKGMDHWKTLLLTEGARLNSCVSRRAQNLTKTSSQ